MLASAFMGDTQAHSVPRTTPPKDGTRLQGDAAMPIVAYRFLFGQVVFRCHQRRSPRRRPACAALPVCRTFHTMTRPIRHTWHTWHTWHIHMAHWSRHSFDLDERFVKRGRRRADARQAPQSTARIIGGSDGHIGPLC